MPAQFLVLPQPISGHRHPILRDLSFETERIHMVGNTLHTSVLLQASGVNQTDAFRQRQQIMR